jgi:hypothetical protein
MHQKRRQFFLAEARPARHFSHYFSHAHNKKLHAQIGLASRQKKNRRLFAQPPV